MLQLITLIFPVSMQVTPCRQKQEEASAAQKPFFHPTGDHLTLASVFFAYKQVAPAHHPCMIVNMTCLGILLGLLLYSNPHPNHTKMGYTKQLQ